MTLDPKIHHLGLLLPTTSLRITRYRGGLMTSLYTDDGSIFRSWMSHIRLNGGALTVHVPSSMLRPLFRGVSPLKALQLPTKSWMFSPSVCISMADEHLEEASGDSSGSITFTIVPEVDGTRAVVRSGRYGRDLSMSRFTWTLPTYLLSPTHSTTRSIAR